MSISRYEKELNEREEANQRFALGNDGYRLFKAAPDMLAALENLLDATERNVLHVDAINARVKAREAAFEAIAKAKGGE